MRNTHIEDERECFDRLEFFYKMCHGYAHGNIGQSRYPLLHYFDVSIMLHLAMSYMYSNLCTELEVDSNINNIDILAKANRDFEVLDAKYHKRSTELFEMHYKNRR